MIQNNFERFLNPISALPFVNAVYLYGSRARGDFHERSDIDLAIDCPGVSLAQWHDITEFLDNAPVLNKIDYVRLDRLQDGLFKQEFERDKKLLYAKDQPPRFSANSPLAKP